LPSTPTDLDMAKLTWVGLDCMATQRSVSSRRQRQSSRGPILPAMASLSHTLETAIQPSPRVEMPSMVVAVAAVPVPVPFAIHRAQAYTIRLVVTHSVTTSMRARWQAAISGAARAKCSCLKNV
jgi:hypothetical protein